MALALMMPLVVTMRHLLRQRMGERRFPTADPPRETCLRDRPYPAFRRGVAMRRPRQQWAHASPRRRRCSIARRGRIAPPGHAGEIAPQTSTPTPPSCDGGRPASSTGH